MYLKINSIWMICRYKIKFISDIEQKIRKLLVNIAVAPFVGVWIEIWVHPQYFHLIRSLPSWECGLKLILATTLTIFISRSLRGSVDWNIRSWMHVRFWKVAPFVGVWIEIYRSDLKGYRTFRRSLRGSVDWNIVESSPDLP